MAGKNICFETPDDKAKRYAGALLEIRRVGEQFLKSEDFNECREAMWQMYHVAGKVLWPKKTN